MSDFFNGWQEDGEPMTDIEEPETMQKENEMPRKPWTTFDYCFVGAVLIVIALMEVFT